MTHTIGCDVSKTKLDFAVMDAGQHVQDTFTSSNDTKGHAEAIERLAPFKEGACVIIEATSSYHVKLALALREAGFVVFVINPIITRKHASAGIRKTKTDRVDAKLLAKVGLLEPELKLFQETRMDMEKKCLSQAIAKLKCARRKMTQRIHQLDDMRDVYGSSGATILLSLKNVTESLDTAIEKLKQRLGAMVKEEAAIVASIPGVGIGTAAQIVAELGDISRFHDRNQVTAFAGLDPSIRESGSSIRGRSRITKRGSPELRGILGQAAWGVMMHNPMFKTYYQKKKSEGKHYFTILVAMAKKLLLIIYSMLKSKTSYDPSRYPQLVA